MKLKLTECNCYNLEQRWTDEECIKLVFGAEERR
jgi:hypothetical protein